MICWASKVGPEVDSAQTFMVFVKRGAVAWSTSPLFLAARPWYPSRWVREAKNQPGGACWGSLAPPHFFLNSP